MLQQAPEASPGRTGGDPTATNESTTKEAPQPTGESPEAPRVRIEGDEAAERSVTLDIGGLITRIRSVEDPDPTGLGKYRAGVHLIRALHNESGDFGLASPEAAPESDIAEQILGITDEAFEAAEDFIMLTEAIENNEALPETMQSIRSSQMCALLLEMKRLSIRDEMRAINTLRPAADRRLGRIGGEFF